MKIKLNVIEEVVKGKRIVMVDDSIVTRNNLCEHYQDAQKGRSERKYM